MSDHLGKFSLILAFAAATGAGQFAHAHGGAENPLFVAANGTDLGDCQDAAAPCRTIGYALSVAGKGAEIRVAAGSYPIDDPEVVFHIVSNSVDVVGGYARRDAFQQRGAGTTTLIGIPPQYRQLLEERGFGVIADTKGLDRDEAAEVEKLLGVYRQLKTGAPPEPCVGGMAGNLECDSIDLLAHVALGDLSAAASSANDVWGFVDLNTGREYAIAGFDVGTAVFDVTEPENPVEVGFVDGQRTTWRDIKVYQFFDAPEGRWRAYAYVTADASTDGLFVIDLGGLPHSIRKTGFVSDFLRAHNVYMTNSDYSTGIAINDAAPLLAIAGSNIGSGQYRAYSLAEPDTPVFVGGAPTPEYMHDASSLIITDSRIGSCANAGTYCEVLLDFNEQSVEVWDITEAANPVRLQNAVYANPGYVHSGWWSENRQFMFVHDELDEQTFGLNTTLRVFSIADLNAPVQVGSWEGPSRAIDHNGFVRGNRYYMSNYTRGLTVLDITDPASPQSAGFLDTYPFSNNIGFQGAWGAYPFFFSNTVAVNDIDTGMYLLRDRTLDVPQGRLGFASASAAADEGQIAQLAVRRTGGSTEAVSVGFEFGGATADEADYQPPSGRLEWAPGDTADKTIDVPLMADGESESMEHLLVRLVDPRGGATLGDTNVASLYLSEPGAPAEIGFFEDAIEIAERGFSTAVVVLQRSGSALGPASVEYTVTGGSAVAGDDYDGTASDTVTWPAGDGSPVWLEFDIVDDGVSEADETFDVTLGNPGGAAVSGSMTAQVTILDGAGRSLAPNAIAGAGQTVGAGSQVTLDGSQSNDPDGDTLSFQWAQVAGPGVNLDDANTALAQFTAPSVTSDTLLQFRLTVTDPDDLSDTATTAVTVTTGAGSGGSGGGAVGWLMIVGLAFAAGLRRLGANANRPWDELLRPISRTDVGVRSSARGRGRLK